MQRRDDFPSWWDEESILMAIDLGFDEGGSGDTLLVSVQVGITEQAKKLTRHWRSKLGERLPYFHSKDFNNYTSGVFTKAGLQRPARVELVKDLAKLVRRHLFLGISARASIKEYEKNTTQDFRSVHGTTYGFLIDMCLLSACQLMTDLGLKPELNILVEDGHRNSKQVAQILDSLKQRLPQRTLPLPIVFLTTGLGSKKDHPILQASDMLAYSQWQGISNGDPTIWNALHKPETVQYRPWIIDCDEEIIRAFVEGEKPKRFIKDAK